MSTCLHGFQNVMNQGASVICEGGSSSPRVIIQRFRPAFFQIPFPSTAFMTNLTYGLPSSKSRQKYNNLEGSEYSVIASPTFSANESNYKNRSLFWILRAIAAVLTIVCVISSASGEWPATTTTTMEFIPTVTNNHSNSTTTPFISSSYHSGTPTNHLPYPTAMMMVLAVTSAIFLIIYIYRHTTIYYQYSIGPALWLSTTTTTAYSNSANSKQIRTEANSEGSSQTNFSITDAVSINHNVAKRLLALIRTPQSSAKSKSVLFNKVLRFLMFICTLTSVSAQFASASSFPRHEGQDRVEQSQGIDRRWERDVPAGDRFALHNFRNSERGGAAGPHTFQGGFQESSVSSFDGFDQSDNSPPPEGGIAAPLVVESTSNTGPASSSASSAFASSFPRIGKPSRQELLFSRKIGVNPDADARRQKYFDSIWETLKKPSSSSKVQATDNQLPMEADFQMPDHVGADPIDYFYVTFANRTMPRLPPNSSAIAPNAMSYNGSVYVAGGQTRIDLSNPATVNGPTPNIAERVRLFNITTPVEKSLAPSIVLFPQLVDTLPLAAVDEEGPLPEGLWGPSSLILQKSGVYAHYGCGSIGVGIPSDIFSTSTEFSGGRQSSSPIPSTAVKASNTLIWRDPETGEVKVLPPSPTKRKGAMLVSGLWDLGYSEALYLIGGCDENNIPIRKVDVFMTVDLRWADSKDEDDPEDYRAPEGFACCGGSGHFRYGAVFIMACDDCSVYNATFNSTSSESPQAGTSQYITPYYEQNLTFWMFLQSDYDVIYTDKEKAWSKFPENYFELFLNKRGDMLASNSFAVRDFIGFLLTNTLTPTYEAGKSIIAFFNTWNFDVHVWILASDEVPTNSEFYTQDSLFPGPMQGELNFSTVVSSNNHLFVVGGSQKEVVIAERGMDNPPIQGPNSNIFQINDIQPTVNLFFYDDETYENAPDSYLSWDELTGEMDITAERKSRFLVSPTAGRRTMSPMPTLGVQSTTASPLTPDSLPYYSYPNATHLHINVSRKVKIVAYPAHIALYVKVSPSPLCDNVFDSSQPQQMTGVTADGLGSTFLVTISRDTLDGGLHYICVSSGVCPVKHDYAHGDPDTDFVVCTFPPYAPFNVNDTSPSGFSFPSGSSMSATTSAFSFPSLDASDAEASKLARTDGFPSSQTKGQRRSFRFQSSGSVGDQYDPSILNQSSVACIRAGCCYDTGTGTCYFYAGAYYFFEDYTLTWDLMIGVTVYLDIPYFPTLPPSFSTTTTTSTTTSTTTTTTSTTPTPTPGPPFPSTTAESDRDDDPFMSSPLFYTTIAGGALLLLIVIVFIIGMFRMCCCKGTCFGWRYGKDPSVTGYVHESVIGGGEDGELNEFIKKSFFRSGTFFGPMLFTDVNGHINVEGSSAGQSLLLRSSNHQRRPGQGKESDGGDSDRGKSNNRSFSSAGSANGGGGQRKNGGSSNANRNGNETPLLLACEDDDRLCEHDRLFPGAYNPGGAVGSGKFNNGANNGSKYASTNNTSRYGQTGSKSHIYSDPPSRRNLDTRELQEEVALAQSRRSDTYDSPRHNPNTAASTGRVSRFSAEGDGEGSNGSNGLIPTADQMDHNNMAHYQQGVNGMLSAFQPKPVAVAASPPPPLEDSEGYKLVRKCGRGAHGLVFAAIASTRYGAEPNYNQLSGSLADLRKSFYDHFKRSTEDPHGGMNANLISSIASPNNFALPSMAASTTVGGYCKPSELMAAEGVGSMGNSQNGGSTNLGASATSNNQPHHHHPNAMALALEQLQFLQQQQQQQLLQQSPQVSSSFQATPHQSNIQQPSSPMITALQQQSRPLPPLFAIKFIRCENEDDMAVAIKEYNVIERVHGQPNLIFVHHVFVYQSLDGVEPHEGMFVCPEVGDDEEEDESSGGQDLTGETSGDHDGGQTSTFGGVGSQGRHHSSRFTFGTLNANTSRLSKTFGRRKGQQLERREQRQAQQQQQPTQTASRTSPNPGHGSNGNANHSGNGKPQLDTDSLYLCIVTDYYPAGDLRRFIKGFPLRHLPEATVLHVAAQLGMGLSFMHQQSPPMVHRDIKPENVLLGLNGDVVITDFGLAHNDMKTYMTTMAGTIHFAAPETFKKHYTSAIDVWGLGCILYAMCSRRADAENSRIMFSDARDVGFEEEVHAELGSYERYQAHNAHHHHPSQASNSFHGSMVGGAGGVGSLLLPSQNEYNYYNSAWNQTTTPTPMQTHQLADSTSSFVGGNTVPQGLNASIATADTAHLPSSDGRKYSYELVTFILSMLRPDPRQRPTAAAVVSRSLFLLDQIRQCHQNSASMNSIKVSPSPINQVPPISLPDYSTTTAHARHHNSSHNNMINNNSASSTFIRGDASAHLPAHRQQVSSSPVANEGDAASGGISFHSMTKRQSSSEGKTIPSNELLLFRAKDKLSSGRSDEDAPNSVVAAATSH